MSQKQEARQQLPRAYSEGRSLDQRHSSINDFRQGITLLLLLLIYCFLAQDSKHRCHLNQLDANAAKNPFIVLYIGQSCSSGTIVTTLGQATSFTIQC